MAEEDFGSWDDEDFDLDAGFSKPAEGNQWEGEDEGLDIKELTAAVVAETTTPASAEDKAKEKKTKAERIAEKKAKRREEVVKPPSEKQQQQAALTPEEQMKNKLELERIQRESDLKIAMETFGEATPPSGGGGGGGLIDSMQPKSSEDFELLQKAITDKLKPHESSPYFVGFMETLLRESCVGLDVEDLRRLSSTLSLLASEKQKTKVVVKSKKKGKALKVGKGAKKEALDYDGGDLGGEFDDYM